jgi:ubiquinone/menaquinone biosynthesis C-methylase UbiE
MEKSQAHGEFCERVFGRNLCQHGFADVAQLDRLIAVTQLGPQNRVLDVGCGNGLIAEYISDRTGAHITGLDYIPRAIQQAQARTSVKADRLNFVVGDINALELPSASFDTVLSIDTFYFSNDYTRTVQELVDVLQPGGQLAILYSYGWEPWQPKADFDANTLPSNCTPLAIALTANGLTFCTQDFTEDDNRLAQLRKQVLGRLYPRFESEGNLFIYENRMGESNGVSQAIAEGLHRRYLYHVRL